MTENIQKMPKGVMSLYFIQAFSTFSFAVLYSSLTLYLTKQLGFSPIYSNSIVGIFLAFNYVVYLLGGVISSYYLSNRTLFLFTTLLQSLGVVLLAAANISFLYLGLSLFLVGNGLNATCYNTILTQRFGLDDNRRENAFILSYAAMYVGYFAGYIISGLYDHSNQYQSLFYFSALINSVTLFFVLFSWRDIADPKTVSSTVSKKTTNSVLGFSGILLLIPVVVLCFNSAHLSNYLVMVMSCLMILIILFLGLQQKIKLDRQKIMAYLFLIAASIIFWMIYFTGPMGIILFIKNNVNRHIEHYEIPTQWILNINALLIICGAPLMSSVMTRLHTKGLHISVFTQFIWGFLIMALSFLFLSCAVFFSNEQGYSDIIWIFLYVIAQSIAELLIGPIGPAMIGRITPVKLQGILMGTWMMVSGASVSLALYFVNSMTKTESVDPLLTNFDYLHVFNQLCACALGSAFILYLLSKKIKGLLDSTEQETPSLGAMQLD